MSYKRVDIYHHKAGEVTRVSGCASIIIIAMATFGIVKCVSTMPVRDIDVSEAPKAIRVDGKGREIRPASERP